MTKKTTPPEKVVRYDDGAVRLFDGEWVECLETGEHYHYESGELRPTPFINASGAVVVSSTPTVTFADLQRPETIEEMVRRLMTHSLEANYYLGEESLDEADDFDIEDDVPDPVTRYELDHGVAVVDAVQRGVVRAPTADEVAQSREVIRRAQEFVKANKAASATPPIEGVVPSPTGGGEGAGGSN